MNRSAFYAFLRSRKSAAFGTRLSQAQVDGLGLLLDEGERRATPLNHLAYILATAWHETAHTMQPIREFGRGRGRKYGQPAGPHSKVYYGRGYVQLTWLENYRRAGKELGVDLVADPDRAMEPGLAAAILFTGMEQGWFTGRKLDDFIDHIDEPDDADEDEFEGARLIVNGTDRAKAIAKVALSFEAALKAAGYGGEKPSRPVEILAFGTNDFDRPEVAGKNITLAVGNSLARGRKPVVVVPNDGFSRIADVAWAVQAAAAEAGAVIERPLRWADDRLHPTTAEYRRIAAGWPGAIVRGDSFAVGIIAAQAVKSPLSWGEVGVSSQRVIAAIAKLDGAILRPADDEDAPAGPTTAPTTENAPAAKRGWLAAIIAMLFGKDR